MYTTCTVYMYSGLSEAPQGWMAIGRIVVCIYRSRNSIKILDLHMYTFKCQCAALIATTTTDVFPSLFLGK